MSDARCLILLVFMAVIAGAMAVRTRYALDQAAECQSHVEALEARLADVEAFADFARPLWPDAYATTNNQTKNKNKN